MFKYKKIFDAQAFRYVVSSNENELTAQLQKLNNTINADLLFIAVREGTKASTLLTISEGKRVDNITYDLAGSPCENVFNSKICAYPNNVCESFPDDIVLKNLAADGYIGATIQNEKNDNIGILVALFFTPRTSFEQCSYYIELFGDYLSAFVQKCHLDNRTSSHLSLLNEVGVMAKTGAWEFHVQTAQAFWLIKYL